MLTYPRLSELHGKPLGDWLQNLRLAAKANDTICDTARRSHDAYCGAAGTSIGMCKLVIARTCPLCREVLIIAGLQCMHYDL